MHYPEQLCDRSDCKFNNTVGKFCTILYRVPIIDSYPAKCPFFKEWAEGESTEKIIYYNQDLRELLHENHVTLTEVCKLCPVNLNTLRGKLSTRELTKAEKEMLMEALNKVLEGRKNAK